MPRNPAIRRAWPTGEYGGDDAKTIYKERAATAECAISADDMGVTFKWKDYRLDGAERYNRVMTLDTSEFVRRFLMHVLPSGFHRIRYYGFLTCQTRDRNIERIRELLALPLIPVDEIPITGTRNNSRRWRPAMRCLRSSHSMSTPSPAV
jgi:Putative transposase